MCAAEARLLVPELAWPGMRALVPWMPCSVRQRAGPAYPSADHAPGKQYTGHRLVTSGFGHFDPIPFSPWAAGIVEPRCSCPTGRRATCVLSTRRMARCFQLVITYLLNATAQRLSCFKPVALPGLDPVHADACVTCSDSEASEEPIELGLESQGHGKDISPPLRARSLTR